MQGNLRLVQGAAIGKQKIYGLVSNLELYSRNVPYEDTQWALCGFVTEDSVYGLFPMFMREFWERFWEVP